MILYNRLLYCSSIYHHGLSGLLSWLLSTLSCHHPPSGCHHLLHRLMQELPHRSPASSLVPLQGMCSSFVIYKAHQDGLWFKPFSGPPLSLNYLGEQIQSVFTSPRPLLVLPLTTSSPPSHALHLLTKWAFCPAFHVFLGCTKLPLQCWQQNRLLPPTGTFFLSIVSKPTCPTPLLHLLREIFLTTQSQGGPGCLQLPKHK